MGSIIPYLLHDQSMEGAYEVEEDGERDFACLASHTCCFLVVASRGRLASPRPVRPPLVHASQHATASDGSSECPDNNAQLIAQI